MRSLTDSARFLGALAKPHRMVTTVDVWFGGEVAVEGLGVAGGSVVMDRNASSLARCDLVLAEPALLPVSGGALSPYGYELHVKRGVRYADGTTELAPLGVFPIQSSSLDGVSLAASISALDRSQTVRDARFEDDYQVAAGTNYATAIETLISAGVSGLEFSFPTVTYTTPLLTFAVQDDRWDAAQGMARSIGHELYFDGLGRCCLRPEPDLRAAVPVWTIADDPVDGVLTGINVELDRGPAFNKVVATSANANNADVYTGSAVDDDPVSPSYYYGPFGKKPRFYSSPFLASNAQCAAAAEAILAANLGVARSINLSAVPNPALEPGDPVLVRREPLGLETVFIIDAITLGLSPEDAMTCEVRSRQEGV